MATTTRKEGSLTLSIFAGGMGAACIALTALMNKTFGESIGATPEGQRLLGATSIVIDFGGLVVLGLIAGYFLKRRNWIGAAVAVPILLACAAFSITSIMGFVASERLAVQQARQDARQRSDENRKAKLDADKARRDTQAKLAEKQLKWIQGTIRKDDLSRRERKEMLEAATKTISAAGQGDAPAPTEEKSAGVVMRPDAQAEMLAELSGRSVSTVQLTLMAWAAGLLVILKLVFWPLAGWFWPRSIEVAVPAETLSAAAPAPPPSPSLPPSGAPAQLQITQQQRTPHDTPVPAMSVARAPKIIEEADVAAQNFVNWCCDTNRAGVKYWGDGIDDVYAEYCDAQNRAPVKANDFRYQLNNLGPKVVEKSRGDHPKTGKKTTYYEIKTRPKVRATPPINRAAAQDVESPPAPANDPKPAPDASPTMDDKPPAPGGGQVIDGRPFGIASTSPRGLEVVKGPAILHRYLVPDLDAQRHEARTLKAMIRQELHKSRKQRGSRVHRMARAA